MTWPDDRDGSYDADKVWDEPTEAWTANDGRQGGRHSVRLIVVSMDSDGNRVIYFGDI